MSDTCINHIEKYWQTLTIASNAFFNKGDFESALTGYKDALYRAEVLNNNISDCIRLKTPFLQVYIISCNNLANTYEELGNKKKAENMLKRVVHYLLHLVSNEEVKVNELQSELKRASLVCLNFLETNNIEKTEQEKLITLLKEKLLENDLLNI